MIRLLTDRFLFHFFLGDRFYTAERKLLFNYLIVDLTIVSPYQVV